MPRYRVEKLDIRLTNPLNKLEPASSGDGVLSGRRGKSFPRSHMICIFSCRPGDNRSYLWDIANVGWWSDYLETREISA
jgi:hypothetical protein